jgi:urease accessory protein
MAREATADMGTITDLPALYRLMAWLSPSYPVGAFSHSHGLEWAVEAGDIRDGEELRNWIVDVLQQGGGRQDAVLLAATWRATTGNDPEAFREVAELSGVLAPSRERQVETMSQGAAFHRITTSAWPVPTSPHPMPPSPDWAPGEEASLAYPVAVGHAAARHQVPLDLALHAYLHAFVANLVSAGLRLFSYGQSEAQALIAELEPAVGGVAREAAVSTLDDIGGAALLADIASMRHETQYTRLFRT